MSLHDTTHPCGPDVCARAVSRLRALCLQMTLTEISANAPDPKAMRIRTPLKPALPSVARGSLQAELPAAVAKVPLTATPDGRRLDFKKNRTGKGVANDGRGTPSHAFANEAYDELRAQEVLRIEADRAKGVAERKAACDKAARAKILERSETGAQSKQTGATGQP